MPKQYGDASNISSDSLLEGFEFVEFSVSEIDALDELFTRLGFRKTGLHRSKPVALFQQGDINFIVNANPKNPAPGGDGKPVISAVALRVKNASQAYRDAISRGAWEADLPAETGPMELNIPAVLGVGSTQIYFVDRYGERTIYDVDFIATDDSSGGDQPRAGRIKALGAVVPEGKVQEWGEWFGRLFGLQKGASSESTDLASCMSANVRFDIRAGDVGACGSEGAFASVLLEVEEVDQRRDELEKAATNNLGMSPVVGESGANDTLVVSPANGAFDIILEAKGR